MPRTYSFDHFTVTKHEMPTTPEGGKARVSGKRAVRGDGRPRYGHRFAETEEMAHVRQMNAQLEELAGVAQPKLSTPREPERAEVRAPSRRPAPARPIAPIGALPIALAAAPRAAPPQPESLRDLLDAGARHLRLLRHCVTDGVAASFRLAVLPLRAAKLTARQLDPRGLLASFRMLHPHTA